MEEEGRGGVYVPLVVKRWIGPKGIRNPTQIALVLEFLEQGGSLGSERFAGIAEGLLISVETVEEAARALAARGVVSRTRIGRRHHYSLNTNWKPNTTA